MNGPMNSCKQWFTTGYMVVYSLFIQFIHKYLSTCQYAMSRATRTDSVFIEPVDEQVMHTPVYPVRGPMKGRHMITAEVIKDSVAPDGTRLTSMLCTYNRFILPEVDTHRKFSRNSASSRATPFRLMLERARECPAPFVKYACEQPGMSGGDVLEGRALEDGIEVLRQIQDDTLSVLEAYLDAHPDPATRLHKSILNRALEWFGWTTTVITSTEWDNFFAQRCHPAAQPEFQALAYKMRDALEASTPVLLEWYGWHIPFEDQRDEVLQLEDRLRVSAARCARTSYLAYDGGFSHEADLRLFTGTLETYGHWSPLEHPAVCLPSLGDKAGRVYAHLGNFDKPWHQMRHVYRGGNLVYAFEPAGMSHAR